MSDPHAKAREILEPHGDYFDEAEDYEACIDHIAAALEAERESLESQLRAIQEQEVKNVKYIQQLEIQVSEADELARVQRELVRTMDKDHWFADDIKNALAAYESARGR